MRPVLLASFALIAALFLSACGGGGSSGGGACGSSCNGCCLGTTCVAGTDVTGCGSGSKDCSVCTAGQTCTANLCTNPTNTGPAVGYKCTSAADCSYTGGTCAADVAGGGYCTASCTASGQCPAGATCVNVSGGAKACAKSCTADANCRAEHLCQASGGVSTCQPKCTQDADCDSNNCNTGTGRCGASRIGNACAADADCGQGGSCDLTNPAGYCSSSCGGQKNLACPSNAHCTSSVCLLTCAAPADCRTGFACTTDSSGLKSCTPKCTDTSQCGNGLKCDTTAGACVEGGPAAGKLGGACTSDPDCAASVGAGSFCATAANGYPGGYCSSVCNSSDSVCTAGGMNGQCVAFPDEKDCLSKCTSPADCRSGYYCYDLGGGSGGVCNPKCTQNTDCTGGTVCDKNSGLCVPPGAGDTANELIDLTPSGPITVSTTQLTAKLSINVPNDAVSINFVGQAISDPTARLVVYRIESHTDGLPVSSCKPTASSKGLCLYDYSSVGSQMKVLPPTGAGAFSVLFPNSPNVPFTPSASSATSCTGANAPADGCSTVQITLLASKSTTASVKAIIKHSPTRALTAGKIKLNLYFVGLTTLNATTAKTDPNFKTIFDSVKSTWLKAGVSVEDADVKYIDITGADAAQFKDLKDSDLGLLMTKTAGTDANAAAAQDNALNVFFVHTISGGSLEGYIILGESAGIPGVPIRGTTGSGMAVTAADFPGGLQDIADTWAHEGGHWLGLFHPTESAGTSFDPLPDTPECAQGTRDTNGDKIMQPSECGGFGADNEMFWTSVAAIPHSNLTPNQSFVLLRNPAVH